ncbi:hypothetical protein [uncultured Tateyamaria sp.]|uniref:hypothetical protein n=1 Tax=uncultured Tateyamaria sp. TaxID=455651 RepID=UPI00260A6B01|nr:hypothetical protein [uncultured Tateyamaria sp.]
MSMPFGPNADFEHQSLAQKLRRFDEVVALYARARVDAETCGAEIAFDPKQASDDMRQRLADASHDLFIAGETLKAHAMVLAGGGVFQAAAQFADDAGVAPTGMMGPY